jgi:hypothetical protein
VFAFIVVHKLSVVKVVLGLIHGIYSKVLGFRSYPRENIFFCAVFLVFYELDQ